MFLILCGPRFSHLCRTLTCDRQMDGQDRQTQDDSIYRPSIASRGKNVSFIIAAVTLCYGIVMSGMNNSGIT